MTNVNMSRLSDVAVVAIGRNEGARLERCLQSVIDQAGTVIYVDSGSSDGSVAMARNLGAEISILRPTANHLKYILTSQTLDPCNHPMNPTGCEPGRQTSKLNL